MLFKGGINMYKKVGIILISAILILGGIGSYARERVVLENTKTNYKTIGSSLAMMYEIKAESGEYQAVNDSVWPQDGINNGVKGQTAAGVYDYEIRNATTLYNARIGLMYISDYAFGVTPDYWNLPISNYNTNEVTSNNWLYENTIQWTISKQNDSASHAYFVDGAGLVFGDAITIYNGSVKPVFYLNSAVILTSGTGTLDDPYRINA